MPPETRQIKYSIIKINIMEIVQKDYTPAELEFKLPEDLAIPKKLGNFLTEEEAREFVAKSFVATQTKVEATRLMDEYEKEKIREDYITELEEVLPVLEEKAGEKHLLAEQAKQTAKDAEDMVKMSNLKVRDLAKEVKAGVKKMELEIKNTWRIPMDGKYYFCTYHNGELLVAKVKEIPEHEKQDLLNSMNDNKSAFKKLKIKSA